MLLLLLHTQKSHFFTIIILLIFLKIKKNNFFLNYVPSILHYFGNLKKKISRFYYRGKKFPVLSGVKLQRPVFTGSGKLVTPVFGGGNQLQNWISSLVRSSNLGPVLFSHCCVRGRKEALWCPTCFSEAQSLTQECVNELPDMCVSRLLLWCLQLKDSGMKPPFFYCIFSALRLSSW